MLAKTFINYRRDDEKAFALRLFEALAQKFGKNSVFFDIDNIPWGEDFEEYITSQMSAADACLVVVGPKWLDARDENGEVRLNSPDDWVRTEIRSALKLGKRILPIVVHGAKMPSAESLPEDIRQLANQQALFAPNGGSAAELKSVIEGVLRLGVRQTRTTRRRWLVPAAATIAFVLGAGVLGLRDWRTHGDIATERGSIAVLPFGNVGDDPKWERLAEGITGDIIADLSRSKDLFVIAHTSTKVFADKVIDVRRIGRELNVRYVLEGTLQAVGDRVRVTAQLIDASTGSHLWAERYDRPAGDVFDVQSNVTSRIVNSLAAIEGVVAVAQQDRARRKPPSSLTAYENYLLGIGATEPATAENLAKAEDFFRAAIRLDPQLARAYVGLGYVYSNVLFYELGEEDTALTRAKYSEAARKAVDLDPNDGEAHASLATYLIYEGRYDQALEEFDRAEALAPNSADVLMLIAWSIPGTRDGQSKRAAELADRAVALNPHYPDWHNQALYFAYFFDGQFEKSIKYARLVKEPLAADLAYLAIAYAHLGQSAEAAKAALKVQALDGGWNAEIHLSSSSEAGWNEREAEMLVEGARKAGLKACMTAAEVEAAPHFARVPSCDQERAQSKPG